MYVAALKREWGSTGRPFRMKGRGVGGIELSVRAHFDRSAEELSALLPLAFCACVAVCGNGRTPLARASPFSQGSFEAQVAKYFANSQLEGDQGDQIIIPALGHGACCFQVAAWLTVHENEASIQIFDRARARIILIAVTQGTDRELCITCSTASPHDMRLPTYTGSQRHRISRP